MDVLDGEPRLSITRDPAPDLRCTVGAGLGHTSAVISYDSPSEPVIAIAIHSSPACGPCVGLDRVGLLRRAPAGALRADRVVLTCVTCGARFTRPDGSL